MALGARADEPASKYSGGMRRRIEIARVLLHEPGAAAARRARPRRRSRGAAPDLGRDRRRCAAARGTERHRDHAPARRGGALPPHRHPRRRPAGRARHARRAARPRSPATSCACAASAPDEIRATGHGAPGRSRAASSTATSCSRRRAATRSCRASPSCSRAGRLASIATSRPTLADVFAKLTGKGLEAADA